MTTRHPLNFQPQDWLPCRACKRFYLLLADADISLPLPHQTRRAGDAEHSDAYVPDFPAPFRRRRAKTRQRFRRCNGLVAYAGNDGGICAAGADRDGLFTRLAALGMVGL